MTTEAMINWGLLILVLVGTFLLIYRFDTKINRFSLAYTNFSKKVQNVVLNYGKLESCSMSYIIGMLIFKYLICPWRHINTAWINKQIWIGIGLYIAIEIIGGIILNRIRKEDH